MWTLHIKWMHIWCPYKGQMFPSWFTIVWCVIVDETISLYQFVRKSLCLYIYFVYAIII